MACGCSVPAFMRDPRSGRKISLSTAVAIGQAVETSDGPAAAPGFLPNASQLAAVSRDTKRARDLRSLKTLGAGAVVGFVASFFLRG